MLVKKVIMEIVEYRVNHELREISVFDKVGCKVIIPLEPFCDVTTDLMPITIKQYIVSNNITFV